MEIMAAHSLPSKLSNLPEFLELLAKNIWLLKQKGFAIIVVLEVSDGVRPVVLPDTDRFAVRCEDPEGPR